MSVCVESSEIFMNSIRFENRCIGISHMRIMCVNFLIFVVFVSLSLSLNFGKKILDFFRVSVCVESGVIFMNRIRFENVYAYVHV